MDKLTHKQVVALRAIEIGSQVDTTETILDNLEAKGFIATYVKITLDGDILKRCDYVKISEAGRTALSRASATPEKRP